MHDNIYDDLKTLQKEMLRILGEVSSLTSTPMALNRSLDQSFTPRCDVFETGDEFVVLVDLAGMEKKSIQVTTTSEYVSIIGERNVAPCSCQVYYYSMEIEGGAFQRRIAFPETPLDRDNPRVTYEQGVLRIAFPRLQADEHMIAVE